MSMLSNYKAYEYMIGGAETALKILYEAIDPAELDKTVIESALFKSRYAAQEIVRGMRDINSDDESWHQLLNEIAQVSEFKAKYNENEQKALIDKVNDSLESIDNLDDDDHLLLKKALVLGQLAIDNERFFYDKLFAADALEPLPSDLIEPASQKELDALQGSVEDLLEREIFEISNIENSDEIEIAAFRTINLAVLIKNKSNDDKIIQAADAIIKLSSKEFNKYDGYEDHKHRNPFKMFDTADNLINELPDSVYKRALKAAFAIHIARATLQSSEEWIKLRVASLYETMGKTAAAVFAVQVTMLENLSKPTQSQIREKISEIKTAHENIMELKDLLDDYKRSTDDFNINVDLVIKIQDVIDNALEVCKQAVAKNRSFTEPELPRKRTNESVDRGKTRRKP